MTLQQLSSDALQKVSGPSWDPLRDLFCNLSETLLNASPSARGELTTIYVKFQVASAPSSPVFAVVWLKSSKKLTVGLALPEDLTFAMLGPAPKGMTYKGLTKYFSLEPGESLPEQLAEWSKIAFETASEVN